MESSKENGTLISPLIQRSENYVSIRQCAICSKDQLELLWDLPSFPFTERYGTYAPGKYPPLDQQLVICSSCGHVQLYRQVKPAILYSPQEYVFRTAQSTSGQARCRFFFGFLQKVCSGRMFQSLLDIGGNDLYLIKMLGGVALEKTVIDPVCQPQDGKVIDGIKVFGRFIEEMDLRRDLVQPDLIVCLHVLEHLARPRQLLAKLFAECAENALYVFEIPCFESLIEARRFDAIFHQHYHYFDLESFKRLIFEAGGEYISHCYNDQGSCGGALLIAFRKAAACQTKSFCDPQIKRDEILAAINDYQYTMQVLSRQLDQWRHQIYGYGASLMLATLAYHLHTDFSELICILDDDAQKEEIGYQNLPVQVRYVKGMTIPPDSRFLITSLENIRLIYQKVLAYQPRLILFPGVI